MLPYLPKRACHFLEFKSLSFFTSQLLDGFEEDCYCVAFLILRVGGGHGLLTIVPSHLYQALCLSVLWLLPSKNYISDFFSAKIRGVI